MVFTILALVIYHILDWTASRIEKNGMQRYIEQLENENETLKNEKI